MAILFVAIHNETATDGLLPEGEGRTAYRKYHYPSPFPDSRCPLLIQGVGSRVACSLFQVIHSFPN